MEDWRLNGQEEYLSDATLYKVCFPEFWQVTYQTQNAFFKRIETYAKNYVQQTGKWEELLEGEKIQQFWHEHCDFCWEKALTYESAVFYCTEDMIHWVCEECFTDFCEQFHWQVRPVEELFGQSSDV